MALGVSEGGWVGVVLVAMGVMFLLIAGLGLAGFLHRRTVIDTNAGTVTQAGRLQGLQASRQTSVANLAAVQICSARKELGTAQSYITYELNLVLHEPPGQRWPVISHNGVAAQQADGRRLAEMLDVPFVDHVRHV